ncbi:hypothetical protein [Achromobacter insolitus]|uniref:hypothetical protein n=1 Tax=Achromobacter insolitus TaxID=217204 RepID=UPI0007C22A65|nr:hypothetical protein [Achromobacter insolitus]OAD17134.1 hypothetical protein A3839_24335 [Achromobacter insolitus]
MAHALDLIQRAMRRIGVLAPGESPTADETKDALAVFNGIIEQFSLDSLGVYRRAELVHTMNGSASYSIGPTGDIVADRPLRIESAFSRLDQLDRGIDVVGDDQFNSVAYKTTEGRPDFLRYDAAMPNGRIDLWPIPDSAYELHLIVAAQFLPIDHPSDEIILPPGYDRALVLTLALDLCGEFQRPIPAGLVELTTNAVAAVRRNNIEPVSAVFDPALTGQKFREFRDAD